MLENVFFKIKNYSLRHNRICSNRWTEYAGANETAQQAKHFPCKPGDLRLMFRNTI